MLPIFGTTLYLLGKFDGKYLSARSTYQDLQFRNSEEHSNVEETFKHIKKSNSKYYKIYKTFNSLYGSPVFENTTTRFLGEGVVVFDEILKQLSKAKKYIFIQQYVIKDGEVWNKLFDILKKKAREGVEIKLIYDPLGCKNAFEDKLTFKKLENYKIDCIPFKSTPYGFGNHRKMIIVDGVTAFVGSYNISDRYTEFTAVDSDWEVSAVRLDGDAVWSLALGFYNDWKFSEGRWDSDYINYKPENYAKSKSNEIVQPILTNPLSNNDETKNAILTLINNASTKVDIFSSFVNIDGDVLTAIKKAVMGGVEINIILSSITDKEINFAMSREQYYSLISSGVNVYELTNNFLRSRMIVVDNEYALVGTIGLDTRWLHLKYENAVLINGKETLKDISKYVENVKHNSKLYTLKDYKERPFPQKLVAWFLKLFRLYY